MATILQHGDKYRAIVRKVGYRAQTKVFARKSDAEKWAREVETDMDKGNFVQLTRLTGVAILERYRDEVAPTRKGGRSETIRINRFVRESLFLRKPLSSISADDIRQWKNARAKVVSDATVRRELVTLSGCITHAMKEWGVKLRVNPCHEVRWPKDGKARDRRPQDDELERLIAHFKFDISRPPCTGRGHVKEATIWVLLLAIETAMRLSEVCRIKWADVDLDKKYIHIPESKTDTERNVPLTPFALQMMRAMHAAPRHVGKPKPTRDWSKYHTYKEDRTRGPKRGVVPVYQLDFSDYVFAIRDANVIGTNYRKARKELGIVGLRFHDTRHEGTTRLADIFDLVPLAKITGHKNPKQLMDYYNPTGAELAEQLHRADAATPRKMTQDLIARARAVPPQAPDPAPVERPVADAGGGWSDC